MFPLSGVLLRTIRLIIHQMPDVISGRGCFSKSMFFESAAEIIGAANVGCQSLVLEHIHVEHIYALYQALLNSYSVRYTQKLELGKTLLRQGVGDRKSTRLNYSHSQ